MKKIALFFVMFFSINKSLGQNLSKKYFEKRNWFSNNKENDFYNSDTILLVKYINTVPQEWKSTIHAENEQKYFGHGKFIELVLNKHNKLTLLEHNYQLTITKIGNWSWKYEAPKNILSIYFDKLLVSAFQPVKEIQINVKSKFAADSNKVLKTIELMLVRLK